MLRMVLAFSGIRFQRVLDRAHRSHRMNAGADAADALGERPGVARIAVLEDDFDAAPHRAGGDGVADHVVVVEIDLDAHMALDARHRIDDDAPAGIVERESVRRFARARGLRGFSHNGPAINRRRGTTDDRS